MSERIGLALGSGAARGWAHIGVIETLVDHGIRPDVVAGSSIGALVGAAWCAGHLDSLSTWVRSLSRVDVLRMLDVSVGNGGFVEGRRLMGVFGDRIRTRQIEDLDPPFVAVATDIHSGREMWLRRGSLLDAVRASISLPGIFTPVQHENRWLVDGGLVNPVPVSVCRALEADVVIAVNLNGDILSRRRIRDKAPSAPPSAEDKANDSLLKRFSGLKQFLSQVGSRLGDPSPGLFDVTSGAINIMQDRITRSRMAGDPPETVIAPRLSHLGLMEFHRADEAISEGRKAALRALPALEQVLGRDLRSRQP